MVAMAATTDATPEPQSAYFASRRREVGLRFVARVYPNRVIGLALGAIAVATVFWTNGASPVEWLAIGVFALVWPHVAYGLGQSASDPYATEVRSLMIDSALGGVFIALMDFNVLPSVLVAVMLSMDKLTVGGLPFLARCTLALVAGCALTALVTGFDFRPETTMKQVYGSLPLLVVYPMIVAFTSYRMARHMRFQARQLQTMSDTDGLSQMLTRQSWEKAVAEEFELCRRTGLAACVAIVDIDGLQEVNERHGYPSGDEVIRSVAAILRDAVRSHDVAGRHGGDKFALLLPGVDAARAAEMLDGARRTISSAVLEKSARVFSTVSVGIAQIEPRQASSRDWIAQADQALQAAKAQGGNRTVRRDALDWTARPG